MTMQVPNTTAKKQVRVWDLFIRLFHWSLVISILANAFFLKGDSVLHHGVGYFAALLVTSRIVWGFIGSRYARFETFPPSMRAAFEQLLDVSVGRKTIHIGHTPLGALMIYNLLLTVMVICVSGYLMTTDAFWGAEWTENLHAGAVWWAEFCAVIHVAAVLYESYRTKVNLPRAMITGYKKLP